MALSRQTLAALIGGGALASAAIIWLAFRSRGIRRIALVGDSLAVGLAPQLKPLFASRGIAFQSEAHSGTTPLQWSNGNCGGQCGSWLSSSQPDVTLVVLGTNDIGYSPSPPVAPYQALVKKWPNVVWVQPPMMPSDRLAGVRQVINDLGVPVIPAQQGLSFAQDNIHPTNYAPWAASIAAAL
jgi:hypothetical protein